jgi:hypothetical protein
LVRGHREQALARLVAGGAQLAQNIVGSLGEGDQVLVARPLDRGPEPSSGVGATA